MPVRAILAAVAAASAFVAVAGPARAQSTGADPSPLEHHLRTVSAADVAPTQVSVGSYAADFKLAGWKRAAAEEGVSFRDYVRTELPARMAGKVVGAIIDPSGRIRVLDGHHTITAVRTIERTMGISVPIHVDIIHDYRGQSFGDYAEHIVGTLGKGYFGAHPPRSAVERVALLPSSFDGLADDPLRSVLGVAFKTHGLEGSWFSDYVQFYVGERLVDHGLLSELGTRGWLDGHGKLRTDAAANPDIVALVSRRVFGDVGMMRFLRAHTKQATRAQAESALVSARASVRQRRLSARLLRRRTPRVRPRQRLRRPRSNRRRTLRRPRLRRPTPKRR